MRRRQMEGEQGERNDLNHKMLESVKLPVAHMKENTESKAIGSGEGTEKFAAGRQTILTL